MIIGCVLVALTIPLPFFIRTIRKQKKMRHLSRLLQISIEQMVHSLKIGQGLPQVLDYVAREGQPPLATEWRRLLQALQVGVSWQEAMSDLEKRVPIPEMKWFVASVLITQQTGGALAEILESLRDTLQERQTLRDKVSALTAQGKASGLVLAALPFILLAVLRLVVPDLVTPMFTTNAGQYLLAGVIISVATGGFVIWNIVNIRVDA
jgi:tight adherence protein B